MRASKSVAAHRWRRIEQVSRSTILYALVCLGVVILFAMAAARGYSPFASGGARPFGFYGARGPTHK